MTLALRAVFSDHIFIFIPALNQQRIIPSHYSCVVEQSFSYSVSFITSVFHFSNHFKSICPLLLTFCIFFKNLMHTSFNFIFLHSLFEHCTTIGLSLVLTWLWKFISSSFRFTYHHCILFFLRFPQCLRINNRSLVQLTDTLNRPYFILLLVHNSFRFSRGTLACSTATNSTYTGVACSLNTWGNIPQTVQNDTVNDN
jgi:hypothetical protein